MRIALSIAALAISCGVPAGDDGGTTTADGTSAPGSSSAAPTGDPSTATSATSPGSSTANPTTDAPTSTGSTEGGDDTVTAECPPFDVGNAPYPSSPALCGVTWDADVTRHADGSDNWAMTWADDGDQYTAYGDGWGFEPMVPDKLSLGLARVVGDPPDHMGINIPSPTGEELGDGAGGKKTSGILFVDGGLYMLVRNADMAGEACQVARSDDYAQSWTWSTWTIPELGYCAFLNFGQAYAGAIDDYVYAYMSDDPSAYDTTDAVVLARVPRDMIMERGAWEFFSGAGSWSADVADRVPVFEFPSGCNRLDVTYDAGVDRYLLVMRARAAGGGIDHLSIYDAPEPTGPWTTVFYTEGWDIDPGEVAHIPSKWISDDGAAFHLVFAGDDSFAVRRGVFELP